MSTDCYGAVLQRADEYRRTFDVWAITTDFKSFFEAPDQDVVLCEEGERDRKTLEQLIAEKYEWPVLVEYDEWQKESRVKGWRVLRWPLAPYTVSVTQLRNLCAEHGAVLMDGFGGVLCSEVRSSGYKSVQENLRALGFVITSSGKFCKVRWNALSAATQEWREITKSTRTRLVPYFTEKALARVGHCVSPTNWPYGHPYASLLRGKEDAANYQIQEILQLIALSQRLDPKSKPWLRVTSYYQDKVLVPALEECFQNIHAVEERCRKLLAEASETQDAKVTSETQDAKIALRFCRWLRAQARALDVKVPKPATLPPKPTKRTLKNRSPKTARAIRAQTRR
jgi:hypothetical protein